VWPSATIGRCCGLHAVRGHCTGCVSRQKLELKGLALASLVVMFSFVKGLNAGSVSLVGGPLKRRNAASYCAKCYRNIFCNRLLSMPKTHVL
jgi:hypothetical protein